MPKVFLSSVVGGMEPMRDAAAAACEGLDMQVLRCETDLRAAPTTTQQACLGLVQEADGVILLLGPRYGEVQASGRSATEEEYDEAVRLDRAVFPFCTVPEHEMEDAQRRFRRRLEGKWADGHTRDECAAPLQLQTQVTRALRGWTSGPAEHEVAAAVGANLARVVPPLRANTFQAGGPWLALSWVPSQRLALEDAFVFEQLPDQVGNLIVAGEHRLAERRPTAEEQRDGVRLRVREDRGDVLAAWLGTDGGIAVGIDLDAAERSDRSRGFDVAMFLPPRVLESVLGRTLAFVGGVLGIADPGRRVLSGMMQCRLSHMGMRLLADPLPQGHAITIPMSALGGDRDQGVVLPQRPEQVVRPKLSASSPLATSYTKAFVRAYRVADRVGESW